jgi:hypothetical protein
MLSDSWTLIKSVFEKKFLDKRDAFFPLKKTFNLSIRFNYKVKDWKNVNQQEPITSAQNLPNRVVKLHDIK